MSKIRAFIAVEIDPPNRQKLIELISHLKKSNADLRWINEKQMHLTLKFLGNIEEDEARQISGSLKSIACNFNGFNIRFSKIGAFPDMHRPRVIWMGIDKGAESLKALNEKIEEALQKLGFEKEKREYKAHLTLGRVKSLKNIPELVKLIDEREFEFQDEIKIDKLILFKSVLSAKGAVYTALSEHLL